MKTATFLKLNDGWNAEPNDPDEHVAVNANAVELTFFLNPWAYDAAEGQVGRLIFTESARWRLGPTNDEGWYRGQCRYGRLAPGWGEFYEIIGPDPLVGQSNDWHELEPVGTGDRHFLFYLRDNTFECIAADWSFRR
ncbi:MAG: hypothetical protein JWN66_4731 [Sphingomonas bacterium]|uniref:hypothetical protein n=1 Tax=Sphingomonas bacterium TaxID=1895847 RepID=UPI00260A0DD8|nr:hypothetical protein [Sphingomonas bacterium]MDB5707615.1 hypothetical protein [Sphingomonas bacterium]